MGSSVADQHFKFGGIRSDPLLAKLYVRSEKFWGWKNGMDLLYHHGEDGGVLNLHNTKGERVCNGFCFFSRFWMVEFMLMTLPLRHWSMEMILISLDKGRFLVVH